MLFVVRLTLIVSVFWSLLIQVSSLTESLKNQNGSVMWSLFDIILLGSFLKALCIHRGSVSWLFNSHKKFCLENVDVVTYWAIETIIKETFSADKVGIGKDAKDLHHAGVEVINIQKIVNLKLLQSYINCVQKAHQRKHTYEEIKYIPLGLAKFKENERSLDINEHYLFHGTTKQAAHSIAQDGFNVQLSNPRSLYGQGVYFAEKFTKADQYTSMYIFLSVSTGHK